MVDPSERDLAIRLAKAVRYLHAFPNAPKAHEHAVEVLAAARAAGLLEPEPGREDSVVERLRAGVPDDLDEIERDYADALDLIERQTQEFIRLSKKVQ